MLRAMLMAAALVFATAACGGIDGDDGYCGVVAVDGEGRYLFACESRTSIECLDGEVAWRLPGEIVWCCSEAGCLRPRWTVPP